MTRLDGMVALITGGARGMGEAHVRHFVQQGARVVFGDVLDDEGKQLAADVGPECHFVHHDVTSETGWRSAVQEAVSRYGRLDALVNNAGILRFQSIAEMTLTDFTRVLEVNVTGTWLGIKIAAEAMRERGGSIVNVSSVEGFIGAGGLSAYSASKFAVRGLTKTAARELGRAGIRVNSIHPGAIATPMTSEAVSVDGVDESSFFQTMPIPRWGEPLEVSRLAAFLASADASYCTGSEFLADGGMLTGAGY